MIRSITYAIVAIFLVAYYVPIYPFVFAEDTEPPDITNVQVINVSDSSVTITWETDEDADSTVNYGLQEDYGIIRVPVADKTQHEVVLDTLEPGRTYYFRVVSSDADGNQGISANYKVITEGSVQAGTEQQSETENENSETTQSQTQIQHTTKEIVDQIQQIKSSETLQEILNETIKAIQGVTEDLTIIGPPTVIPETTSALIRWTTNRESNSEVFFSPASEFVEGQYRYSQVSTEDNTTEHEVRIIGLEPYTEYHFQVKSKDKYGLSGSSRDYTFKTKASLPDIKNIRIVKVEEDSATLAWDTTVPAKALIDYQDMSTGAQNTIGRPTFSVTHQLRIADLTLGTRYVAFVNAENAGGDRVRSQPITFITVKDNSAPIISNVTNESTLFPGGESRIQTIIEWVTDEPAHCILTYREGISGGIEPVVIDSEENDYTMQHVEVVIDFAPATVYQFWLDCGDESGNTVTSENFVLFTPMQEKNIIDIIIENFESTFGWVKNIGG
jgi:hypothetical protein